MEDLLIDRITLYRESDSLLSTTLPVNSTVNKSFTEQPTLLEFIIVAGTTASFLITGIQNSASKQETITFDTSINKRITLNSFDGVTSIQSLGGNSTTVLVKLRSEFGQPIFTETALITNYPARISKDREGALTIRRESLTIQDKNVCFLVYGPNKIRVRDELLHVDTQDRYKIVDVDDINDSDGYHHTEAVIGYIDIGQD